MNDDHDLDRALSALPLEEPPPELHGRILAATILAQPPAFRPWELWLIGTLLALAAWLCVDLVHAGAPALAALATVAASTGVFSAWTFFWLALGLTSAVWISNLTLMPQPRVAVTKRT